MQERTKGLVLGSIAGGTAGVLLGGVLAALFWDDVAAAVRKIARRLLKRDEGINFEILLQ